MKTILVFLKKRWRYVLTAVIALIIGSSGGPSQSDLDKVNAQVKSLQKQLTTKTETVASLKSDNKDLQSDNKELQAKVDEAAPWFKLSETEKANQQKEADAKAAELAKKEEQRKAAEAKAEEEKKKAEEKAAAQAEAQALAAKTKTFGAGKYLVGRDIEPGLYDAVASSGQGNFFVNDGMKVNEMFGVGGGFYNGQYNNLELEDGDTIDLNNDLHVKFVPK
ncbi:hypothetical protein M3226_25085 [Neobacillus cucumis]|uniref:hypothetical protein n=1 Tax=Neobacillus cucumis TaxID=1740721 RepID=UPI0020421C20|nr:hypothetical protein [Neobacillus cucumis]MCM3728920.1 hypothetical protein [Neobacillus cucumis]